MFKLENEKKKKRGRESFCINEAGLHLDWIQ